MGQFTGRYELVEAVLMRSPLVLSENADVAIFKDIESLLRYVEPIDVANAEYVVYDRDGRLIRLHVEKITKRALFGLLQDEVYSPVTFEEEKEPTHANDLRAALACALKSIDPTFAQQRDEDLDHLLAIATEKLGYTT